MKDYIEERARTLAQYIIENKSTVRDTARIFNISKSTVHKDVAERIWQIDKELAQSVDKVLQYNKADRHLRGGIATKHKYETMKNSKKWTNILPLKSGGFFVFFEVYLIDFFAYL